MKEEQTFMETKLEEIKGFIQNKSYELIKQTINSNNFSSWEDCRAALVVSIVESNFDSNVANIVFDKICTILQDKKHVQKIINSRNEADITVLVLMFLCFDQDSKLLEKAMNYRPNLSLSSNLPTWFQSLEVLSKSVLDTHDSDKLVSFDHKKVNKDLETPILHLAVRYGNKAILTLLLGHEAKVNAKATDITPLHLAAYSGDTETVRLILKKVVSTAIYLAAKKGYKTALDQRSAKKAKIEEKNDDGLTALHLAIKSRNEEAVSMLLEQEADIFAKDNNDDNPLHLAASSGNSEAVELLLNRNVKVNEPNEDGNTALHLDAKSGDTETVELLLAKNADTETIDINKRKRCYSASLCC